MSSSYSRLLPRLLVLLAGAVLGIALLVLLLRRVNFDQLGADLSSANYAYLALAFLPLAVNLVLKVPRWTLLFGQDAPNFDTLFGAMNVGYAINTLLPARLGEIVRAYWVRDRSGVSMVKALSTIALERVMDGLTLLILLLLVAPSVAFPRKLLAPALSFGVIFVALLLGMLVLVYLSTREDHPVSRMLQRLESGRWAVVGGTIRQLVNGLQALRNGRAVALIVVYTLVIWFSNALLIWLVLRSLHLAVPITAGILLSSLLNLGMAIPSLPGYIGVFEGIAVVGLSLYGVPYTPALAAALVLHVLAFVPVTIIGLTYIGRAGVEVTLQMVRASATRSS